METFLELQKHTICTHEEPCFKAYDIYGKSQVIDLTDKVQMGQIVLVSRSERQITYALSYFVADNAGKF